MSETTKAPKAEKAEAKTNSNGGLIHDDETALALTLYHSIPESQRKQALIDAQMAALGQKAYAFLADGFKKLTGEALSDIIILDGESGIFGDPEEMDDEDFDCDEDEDEDEDAIDAVSGEDTDDEPKAMSAKQAVRALKKYMKDHEYSQAYIARKLKVSQPCVSTWIAGSNTPRAATVKRIERLVTR